MESLDFIILVLLRYLCFFFFSHAHKVSDLFGAVTFCLWLLLLI